MVLRYWGEHDVTADTFAPLVDRSAAGIRTGALVAELNRRGWMTTAVAGTDPLLTGELAAGRPVIALIQDRPGTFHYIVLVAVTADRVILHDPARAPFRVLSRAEFDRRWKASDRWMAVVTPPARAEAPAPAAPAIGPATPADSCDGRIQRGIAQAQANDLTAAEQTLVAALACPGPAAGRELAGVRALQRRWDEAATLATQALALDPSDAYTWRLLGTSRFLLNRPMAALDAWNYVGEPLLDLLQVEGLVHTRQRPVERLIALEPGTPVTAGAFARGERALRELPSAAASRLELLPASPGRAVVRAVMVERPLLPHGPWSLGAIGANAVIARTLGVTFGSFSGGGESLAVEWRFWPQRPRLAASFRAPAPWPGTWGVDVYGESQAFDRLLPEAQRRGGRLVAAGWATHAWRLELRGGADRWVAPHVTAAALGGTVAKTTPGDRVTVRASVDGWAGSANFASGLAGVMATTAARGAQPRFVVTVNAAAVGVTSHTPLDLWPAGDTGQARAFLLRAHPVLDAGRLRIDQLGRRLAHGSVEAQRWWNGPAFSRVGAAAFVDAARTSSRLQPADGMGQVDVGVGVRLSSTLVPGGIALDVAHGLRDGRTAFSARYVAAGW